MNKFEKKQNAKVKKFYLKRNTKINFCVPNETIFRLLGELNFNYKNKNCLDVGIGNGDNLLEFKRRGANIFGIDIRDKIIKKFVKNNRLSNKNFFHCDLNESFPIIEKKIDLCLMKDTLYYLSKERRYRLFSQIYKILKKNGFFLFQYIQEEFLLKEKNFFSYNFFNNSKKLRSYHIKSNPIAFIKKDEIINLISKSKFKIKKSIFDINTHTKNNRIITINRYFLLKR